MRSACNEIRFDQFQPVTKKLTWQVATNPIKDLRIKKLPRDHFIKSTLQNSLWSNFTHSHCVFQKNVPNSLVALFSFVSVFYIDVNKVANFRRCEFFLCQLTRAKSWSDLDCRSRRKSN